MTTNRYLLLQTNPSHSETEVPLDTTVTVRFAKDMDVSRMNLSYFSLQKVNGGEVTGSVRYRNSDRTMVFTPDTPLDEGMSYQGRVTGGDSGVQSIIGETLVDDHVFTFETAGEPSLAAPSSVQMTTDAQRSVHISWEHPSPSEATFEVRLSTSKLNPDTAPGAVVWPLEEDNVGTIQQSPVTIYRPMDEGTYYAYVRALRGDETSGWMQTQGYVEASTSSTPSQPSEPTENQGLFELLDTYPQQGAIQAYPDEILLQFSQELDVDSVTPDRVYLVPQGRTGSVSPLVLRTELSPAKAVDATVQVDDDDQRIISLIPAEALTTNTSFTVVVRSSVRSASGSRLGGSLTFGFDTSEPVALGSMQAVKELLDASPFSVSDSVIQRRLRAISAYAQEIMERRDSSFDPANPPYYVDEYINTKVTYDMMVQALSQMATSSGSRQLAELSIDDGSSSSDSKAMLDNLAGQVRQWKDLLYGQHGRGYAQASVVARGVNGEDSDPDFFSRSEFTEAGGG